MLRELGLPEVEERAALNAFLCFWREFHSNNKSTTRIKMAATHETAKVPTLAMSPLLEQPSLLTPPVVGEDKAVEVKRVGAVVLSVLWPPPRLITGIL